MRICSSRCFFLVARSSLSSSRCFFLVARSYFSASRCSLRWPAAASPLPDALCVSLLLLLSPPVNLPEHKIGVFVRFWGLEPSFSGISSTKSRFLCAFGVWNPRFLAFRAQKRHFCAFLPSGTPIFWHFEHKIEVFVRFLPSGPPFSGFSSTKSAFLCSGRRTSGVGKCKSDLRAIHRARFKITSA